MSAAFHKVKLPNVASQEMDCFQKCMGDIAAMEGIKFKYRNLNFDLPRPANSSMPCEKPIGKCDALGDGGNVFANCTMVDQTMARNLGRLRANVPPKSRNDRVSPGNAITNK
jgi:hypothetical protein